LDEGIAHAGLGRRSDRPDAVAFGDSRAPVDRDGAQVRERDRPAVGGLDRQRAPAARDRPGPLDDTSHGCAYDLARLARDLDGAVLAGCVGMRAVEGERLQDHAVDRPGPRPCCGSESKRREGDEQEASHWADLWWLSGWRTTPP